MNTDLLNLKRKVGQYKEVLQNTRTYRESWDSSLRETIKTRLEELVEATGLNAVVEERDQMENLGAIALSLGEVKSGMYQLVGEDIKRHLIKHNGSLIYQQLFNGKIIVLIQYPFIENYGQPSQPKTIAIYRPEEIKDPYLIRHMEEFIQEITQWEDYDDDEPHKRIGFDLNFPTPVEEQ
jgi:hypothetical protein